MKRKVIAEIGINHDGEISVAKELIEAAVAAECYAVKFQYRNDSRMYSGAAQEIGEEIISEELKKAAMSIESIFTLSDFAKKAGIKVGISCFTVEDFEDIIKKQDLFDFFKVPSVELLNFLLIDKMLATGKLTYLSLGAHSEEEIAVSLNRICTKSNWMPMHCVSNYPTALQNAKLGYITYLRDKWKREVGFSSHDLNWEVSIAAFVLGATTVERHITRSRIASGLDHSTSSTPNEFQTLSSIAREIDQALLGEGPRMPNQGELLNRQNLGRSFYAKKDLEIGEVILARDFEYRNPQTGLDSLTFQSFVNSKIVSPLKKNSPLSKIHTQPINGLLSVLEIEQAKKLKLSIPVRLHDYLDLRKILPIGSFEFHLSYKEVATELSCRQIVEEDNFSVHIPDYLNSSTLIDPFSDDKVIREESINVVRKVMVFAQELGQRTNKVVPVVGSFTGIGIKKSMFYRQLKDLSQEFQYDTTFLTVQWLPPFAWYFGGSVKLPHLNQISDLSFIEKYEVPLTMDFCHLLMGTFGDRQSLRKIWETTFPFIRHQHVSDARGIDGEGVQIGKGDAADENLIELVMMKETIKVLEVWQGHLDGYDGFRTGLRALTSLRDTK